MITKYKGQGIYSTKDQFLASVLYLHNKKNFIKTENSNGRVYMYFSNVEECKKIVGDYFSGEVKVDAKELFDGYVTIKNIIYNKLK